MLWANLHLLFWLSLIPFTTGWMGRNHFQSFPTAVYGVNLLLCAIAYTILQTTIVSLHEANATLAAAVGSDLKGKISALLYVASIPLAFWRPWISDVLFVVVALIWLAPDRRIEAKLNRDL